MPLVSNMSEIISREVVFCNHCVCSSVVIAVDVESCLWWLEDIPDTLGRFYGLLTRGNKVLIVPYLDLIWFHFPTSDHVNYFYWSPHRQHRAGECTDEPSLGIMVGLSLMCWDKHCSHAMTHAFSHTGECRMELNFFKQIDLTMAHEGATTCLREAYQ